MAVIMMCPISISIAEIELEKFNAGYFFVYVGVALMDCQAIISGDRELEFGVIGGCYW